MAVCFSPYLLTSRAKYEPADILCLRGIPRNEISSVQRAKVEGLGIPFSHDSRLNVKHSFLSINI